jgi:hypothetical protein
VERRKIDVILSSVLILASVIILTDDNLVEGGLETDLGSLFLPRIVAAFMMVFAAFIGIQSLIKINKKVALESSETIDVNGFLGIFIYIFIFTLYWFLVPRLGFLITTPFVMLAISWLLGGRSWIPMISLSLVIPLLVFYGARQFLRVYLPTWAF